MRRTIFVSSTFRDLQTHRKAVWDMLGSFDVSIRGMEQFGARKESPLETCLVEVEQSDIYVGIIGFRHGSIEPTQGKSYTQIEYERALELRKDVLLYLIDEENARVPIKFVDQGPAREKLEAFKSTLRERHTVDSFVDERDLATKLKRDLGRLLSPRQGIVDNPDELASAKATLAQFFLLPKSVAGTEIRLRVRTTGSAYPVSRQACRAFNLEFGATIGVPVTIVLPEGAPSKDAFDLFIGEKQVGDLLPLAKGDAIDVYVRLHFSETEIDQPRARFRTKIEYPERWSAADVLTQVYGEPVTHPADSAVAIEVSRLLAIERSSKSAA